MRMRVGFWFGTVSFCAAVKLLSDFPPAPLSMSTFWSPPLKLWVGTEGFYQTDWALKACVSLLLVTSKTSWTDFLTVSPVALKTRGSIFSSRHKITSTELQHTFWLSHLWKTLTIFHFMVSKFSSVLLICFWKYNCVNFSFAEKRGDAKNGMLNS